MILLSLVTQAVPDYEQRYQMLGKRPYYLCLPIHEAILTGKPQYPQGLIEAAARFGTLDAVDSTGNTALHLAVQHKFLDAVRALVNKGASLKIKNINGFTVLDLAKQLNASSEIIRALNKCLKWDTSSLMRAIAAANTDNVAALLKQGMDTSYSYKESTPQGERVVTTRFVFEKTWEEALRNSPCKKLQGKIPILIEIGKLLDFPTPFPPVEVTRPQPQVPASTQNPLLPERKKTPEPPPVISRPQPQVPATTQNLVLPERKRTPEPPPEVTRPQPQVPATTQNLVLPEPKENPEPPPEVPRPQPQVPASTQSLVLFERGLPFLHLLPPIEEALPPLFPTPL